MEDTWSLKEYQPEGSAERWYFRKNETPSIPPRNPEYGWLAYFTLLFQPKDRGGLPNRSDEDTLCTLEKELSVLVESEALAIQVAAVLKPGVKDLLFYTRDPHEFLRRAEPIRDRYSERFGVGCEILSDPEWSQYADLP